MKKNLFLFAAVLLMLAGCSSNDDEITINDGNILGYWESTATVDGRGGLLFVPDGEIKDWGYSLVTGTGQYSESHWGYFWFDEEGTLIAALGTVVYPPHVAPN